MAGKFGLVGGFCLDLVVFCGVGIIHAFGWVWLVGCVADVRFCVVRVFSRACVGVWFGGVWLAKCVEAQVLTGFGGFL